MVKAKQVDPLIGHDARINPEATFANGDPHPFAGKVVTVLTRNPGGNYQVQFGDEVKVVHISDVFPVVDTADGTGRATLVVEEPGMAVPSLTNPRRRKGLDVDSIADLAASIKMHTQLQAILVRPLPAHRLEDTAHLEPRPIYEVVAGERRWRACVFGEMKVDMIVRQMSDAAVLEMQLVENVHREDLDDMEEAEGFDRMRTQLGFTAAQIADRLGPGKGKSYVLKSLKLCDLVPAAREAMYATEGKPAILSRSTGLLVARYRPEQQEEIVAYIASLAGPNGEPMQVREVQARLANRYHLELAHAPFDIQSIDLVPAAGACTACPKRTTSQSEIFEDALAGPDSCTDADCFAQKREAHVVLVRADAQRKGIKVIDGEEARRARPAPGQKGITGFVRLDDVSRTVDTADGEREMTFADELAAMGKKAPKPRLFIDPHTSQPIKVITAELANKLVPAEAPAAKRGAVAAKTAAVDPPDNRSPAEVAICIYNVGRAVLLRMFDTIRNTPRTEAEMRLIGAQLFKRGEGLAELPEYLGWGNPDTLEIDDKEWDAMVAQHLAAMPADQLGAVLAMAGAEHYMNSPWTTDDQAVALATSYGIDVLAVRDKVAEDLDKAAARLSEEGDDE